MHDEFRDKINIGTIVLNVPEEWVASDMQIEKSLYRFSNKYEKYKTIFDEEETNS